MALTKIGSIGINTGIAFAGVTTIATLNASDNVLSVGGTVNFVSDVSIGGTVSIAGTLTYEDVTNVDAVGLITARDGIVVGSGITLSVDGDGFFTGVITATSYSGIDLSDVTGATGDFSIADKIVHTGDTNTAIRFPSADTFTVETGGTERLRINSSGKITTPLGTSNRIGISDRTSGTGAGGSLLVTAGAARGSGQTTGDLLLTAGRGNNAASNGQIRFGFNDGSDGTGIDQEHARIESAGNVNVAQNLKVAGVCTATSFSGDGSNLSGISVGITTEAYVVQAVSGITTFLDLSKDDHKITASGITTVDVRGGTEASSHTLRIENSGITTVGFSTYFLFPSGGTPNLPTTDGAISLISFTIHRAGAVGLATQLLAGASVNFS